MDGKAPYCRQDQPQRNTVDQRPDAQFFELLARKVRSDDKERHHHQVFADFFDYVIENNGEFPTKKQVCDKMRELNVCGDNETTIGRRSSSVRAWLRWIFNLPNLA